MTPFLGIGTSYNDCFDVPWRLFEREGTINFL